MESKTGNLKKVIREAHYLLEARGGERIPQKGMADLVGVGYRTFVEWERGTNEPSGMKALLNLLNNLPDDEILRVVRKWGSYAGENDAK